MSDQCVQSSTYSWWLLMGGVIVCIVAVLTCLFSRSVVSKPLTYLEAMQIPFYTDPEKQIVDPNKVNIIIPRNFDDNGEYFIARDLKLYFEKQGKIVKIFAPEDYYDQDNFIYMGSSVNIYLYGWVMFYPNVSGVNISYILWPGDQEFGGLSTTHLKIFDRTVSSSKTFLNILTNIGIESVYIPQFTNSDIFYSEYDPNMYEKVLFVGRARHGDERKSVVYALEKGTPLSVYGQYWEDILDSKILKGEFIPNEVLHKYYTSADIVLNDHRTDMVENGFISNRVFDVTASGGFLISDYLPELEEIYGDSVPTYKNAEEYAQLIRFYLKHPDLRKKLAEKAHKITMDHFTLDRVGKQFEDLIEILLAERAQSH